ncbi:(2Fe-2S) ferredoxin domain-containing protein [Thermosynechococcaceae cyanobacterium BACA0444]|uniref:(2Fe-2S) ferredoxin domain-containing protein n=1 Tax=Pseudocalidococcus azoricus BACA0444 TaxID=2918990 RepID=A0AAE4FS72_9CYAN|nr:(2Fe-2S) ferredoxin domain-containing protein [Pseudocalidococcus azoricus]MDS3861185.1 (2Fe-2S) ferredoxin domain-containing protein [Pseudocalidococcus azoricus BACA0444]
MATTKFPRIQPFSLTGVVTAFDEEKGPYPKVIYLKHNEEIYRIKLTKLARKSLQQPPGLEAIIQVSGEREYKPENNQFRYKAHDCQIVAQPPEKILSLETGVSGEKGVSQPRKILICQKSNCCRRGGTVIWDELTQEIAAQGLEGQITLKAVGCIGECKRGPALVVMPSKSRFTHVTPSQVPQLLAACTMH